MASVLTSLSGLTALLLADLELYSTMSHIVTRRTREIGIRMELGAQMNDVLKAVVRQGMSLAAPSMVIGLAAALLLTRLIAKLITKLLYGVGASGSTTFAVIALLLTLVAYLPSGAPGGASRPEDCAQARVNPPRVARC